MQIDEPDFKTHQALEALTADSVQAFVVFARRKNFTHAAEDLDIAQSSLHTKINKLQTRIGVDLYLYHGKHILITPEGEELARYATDANHLAQTVLTRLHHSNIGPISIAAGRGGFLWVADKAIQNLAKRQGGLKILTAQNDKAIEYIKNGVADIAVIGYQPPPDELHHRLLASYEQTLVTAADHPLAKREHVTIQDLDNIGLALPQRGNSLRDNLTKAFQTNKSRLNVEAEALNWDLLLRFVTYGIEGTIINDCIPTNNPNLKKTPIQDLPEIKYHLIWRAERNHLANEFHHAYDTTKQPEPA